MTQGWSQDPGPVSAWKGLLVLANSPVPLHSTACCRLLPPRSGIAGLEKYFPCSQTLVLHPVGKAASSGIKGWDVFAMGQSRSQFPLAATASPAWGSRSLIPMTS